MVTITFLRPAEQASKLERTISVTMGEMKGARIFRNYKVWQDAVTFAIKVYKVTTDISSVRKS